VCPDARITFENEMVIVFLAINRAIAAIAILLIVPGIVGLVHPSFTYHQTEEIAKIASLDATVNRCFSGCRDRVGCPWHVPIVEPGCGRKVFRRPGAIS